MAIRKLLLRVVSGMMIAACLGPAVLAQERGGVLTTLHWPEPPIITGGVNSGFTVNYVSTKVYEGLLRYDQTGAPRPVLAKSWTVSEDGLTITFHLRDGVKWHDGAAFTSSDVKFSIEEIWKKLHSRGRLIFANVERVETPDDLTVELHLSTPSPALMDSLNSFTSPVLPAHVFAGTDILGNPAINKPIGTGPWIFREWQRGNYILFDRNPNYWDKGKPYLDRLVIRYVPDAAARSALMESGEAQLAVQSPVALSDVERLASLPNLKVTTEGYQYFSNMLTTFMNTRRKPFNDVRVRQALAYAMNRQSIIDSVWFGYGKIATGPIPSYSPFYTADVAQYGYDPGKAIALLEQAGYPPDRNGVRLRLTYDVTPLGAEYQRMGEVLKQQLGKVGIQVTLRSEDVPANQLRMFTKYDFDFTTEYRAIYKYPVLGAYWGGNITPGVPMSNSTGYANPRVDQLIQQSQVEPDHDKQVAIFHEIQKIVADDVPVIVMSEMQPVTIYNVKLHDHSVTDDGPFSSLSDAWLEN